MTHTEPFSASDDPETQAFLDTLPRKLHEAPLRWAADTPDGIAISDPTRRLTYAELGAAISAAAARLVAHGVRPGDRVAVINENGVTSAVLIYAVSAAGADPRQCKPPRQKSPPHPEASERPDHSTSSSTETRP